MAAAIQAQEHKPLMHGPHLPVKGVQQGIRSALLADRAQRFDVRFTEKDAAA
jgi:hypothetical protein